jgi:plastocyanin
MSSAPIVDRIRIIPRPTEFLNRNVGASGEVFFSKETSSLRVYSGKDVAGFELARADLNNVTGANLLSKLTITNDDISWIAYNELVDLPSATDNHGMFAHVHGTGKAYYAHAGAWVQLANQADLTSVADISELTDTTNLIPADLSDLTDTTNLIPAALTDLGITDGNSTQILTTDGAGNFTFEDAPATGSTQNLFATITSDDGSTTANAVTDTLSILGGTNIATAIATDSDDVTINMSAFSIDFLSDVDTTTSAPTSGQVLKWDGAKWAPGSDATTGGGGTDADTLDGFDGTYYLDWGNVTNKPSILTLASLSVGNELAATGDGAIAYDDTTGVFRYTPPDLSTYLTSVAFADLTTTPTTLAGYGITDALPSSTSIPTVLTDLSISDGTTGQVLTTDGSGGFTFTTIGGGGGGDYSDSDVNAHLNTTSASTSEVLSWTGSDFDWVAQSGETNQNAFSNVSVSGQNTVTADSSTDTLTLSASTGISLTTSGNTVTIASTVSAGASNFDGLSDVTTAGLTIDKIYEPAIVMLRVDNVSASAYTFNSHYSGNNPNIYALSGTTIAFDLDNIPGHPFEIQDSTSSAYNTGLVHVSATGTVSTGSNAQGKSSGTLYWRIPENISGTYRYQCQSHSAMVGGIVLKRLSVI